MIDATITWTRRLVDATLILLVAAVIGVVALNVLAPAFGREAVVVRGASMQPAIPLGSLVLVTRDVPSGIRPGDVVSLRLPGGGILTHRVTRLPMLDGKEYVETRGDANPSPDPVVQPIAEVIGRVDMTIPLAGFLLALLTIPSGILTILGFGGCLVLASWLLEEALLTDDDEEPVGEGQVVGNAPSGLLQPDAGVAAFRATSRSLSPDGDGSAPAAIATGGGR